MTQVAQFSRTHRLTAVGVFDDDTACFAGPPVGACFGFPQGDVDYDGIPYASPADSPDGSSNHPTSFILSSPLSFSSGSYSAIYGTFNFQTDIPASENTASGAGTTCLSSGSGCTVPPTNSAA